MANEQSPEEIHAHMEGVGNYALTWVELVTKIFRWDMAMATATEELREGFVDGWLAGAVQTGELTAGESEGFRNAVLGGDFSHPRFDRFAIANFRYFSRMLDDARDNLAIGSRPRPFDLDHEDVTFVDYRELPEGSRQSPTGVGAVPSTDMDVLLVVRVKHVDGAMQVAHVEFNPDHVAARESDPGPAWELEEGLG